MKCVMKSVAISLSLMFILSGCRLAKNFREVDPGKFYRSAQLTGPELETAIQAVSLKTIINLRGASPGHGWYDDEIAVSARYGVRHVDIGLSAKKIPRRESLLRILEALRDSPRPILTHCLAGADRTGLVSTLYQMEYMGLSKKKALRMLTPVYLHIPWATPAPRYFIRLYQGAEWAQSSYDPCRENWKYFNKAECAVSSEEVGEVTGPAGPEAESEDEAEGEMEEEVFSRLQADAQASL